MALVPVGDALEGIACTNQTCFVEVPADELEGDRTAIRRETAWKHQMVGAAVKTPAPSPQPAQKMRPTPPQREAGSSPRRPGRPAPIIRVVVSLLIVWHFTGIFFAALSIIRAPSR